MSTSDGSGNYAEPQGGRPGEEASRPNDYLRPRSKPNTRWICGYQAIGNACEEGPTSKGVCCQRARLLKSERSNKADEPSCDTNCSCADTCELAGMRRQPALPSHEQLGPCVPRKTEWYARQSIAINAAILTGGILLLCMALPIREEVFVPGGLSSKHSQILGNRLVSERCSQCHSPVHGTLIESLTGDFVGEVQDDKCMTCHQSHMPDAGRRSPHDLTDGEIRLISRKLESLNLPSQGLLKAEETSCASCHLEHHGSEHNITSITDARCQACHQKKFGSLSSGHPEFDGFPYRSQRSIKFDHSSHSQKHFSSKSQKFDCQDCHIQSNGKADGVFRTLGFEQACSSCHAEPIRAAGVGGWAILQLPSLDSETAAQSLPFWPDGALYGFDGPVTPVMQTLLSGRETQAWLEKLPRDRQLASVEDKLLQKEMSTATAVGVRKFIFDVADGGQSTWRSRLVNQAEAKLGRSLNAVELKIVDEMTAGLPPDLFQQMVQRWLQRPTQVAKKVSATEGRLVSQSDEDLLLGDDDEEEALLGTPASEPEEQSPGMVKLSRIKGAEHLEAGGWYLDEQLYALRYMPRGHGDLTLAAWSQYLRMLQGERQSASTIGDTILDNCLECHQLDGRELAGWADWKATTRPAGVKLFTKFDHSPHLTLPAISDCKYCHQLVPPTKTGLQPIASNLSSSVGADFVPMKLEQCSACHQKGGAKDGCTTCHNYHVGTDGLKWSRPSGDGL